MAKKERRKPEKIITRCEMTINQPLFDIFHPAVIPSTVHGIITKGLKYNLEKNWAHCEVSGNYNEILRLFFRVHGIPLSVSPFAVATEVSLESLDTGMLSVPKKTIEFAENDNNGFVPLHMLTLFTESNVDLWEPGQEDMPSHGIWNGLRSLPLDIVQKMVCSLLAGLMDHISNDGNISMPIKIVGDPTWLVEDSELGRKLRENNEAGKAGLLFQ